MWHFVTVRHWNDSVPTVPLLSGRSWGSQGQKYIILCPHLKSVKGTWPHRSSFIKLGEQRDTVNKSKP